MKNLIAFVVFGLACSVLADSVARVEEKIWNDLQETETTNILITFKKANIKAANTRIAALKLTSRNAILTTQHAILKDHADIVQADVTAMLNKAASNGKTHRIAQLWISNELIVRNVDIETVEKLRSHPDVESLQAEWFIPLLDVVEEETVARSNNSVQNALWNVQNTNAPAVWALGNYGEGAVVGIIDTGIVATHVQLRSNYRGNQPGQDNNYNWFGPAGQDFVPSDSNGHGTHVAGSAVGSEGVGVAPRALHISCRGCGLPGAGCSIMDLTQCGNWIACPTDLNNANPDCQKAPNVVNNSWGGAGGANWYDAVIGAWRTARIAPVFSSGNSGAANAGCSNLLSPGDREGAFSVGSIQQDNQRSAFSSNGPTLDGRRNPLIAAPGTNIESSSNADDYSTRLLSGTSMAAPHITGVIALLYARNPAITLQAVQNAIEFGGIPNASVGAATCGGIPDNVFPNNHVGFGRIDALRAYQNSTSTGI